MEPTPITLTVGPVTLVCQPSVTAEVADALRAAVPRAVTNWADVVEAAEKLPIAPVVQVAVIDRELHALIHLDGAEAAVHVSVPSKAQPYDFLAKVLRALEQELSV